MYGRLLNIQIELQIYFGRSNVACFNFLSFRDSYCDITRHR
jgi:hypothetical protein